MVWEEYVIRRQALKVRGVRPIRGIRGMVNRAGLYVVPLAQSIRRAHRVAAAMEAKQFDGDQAKSRTYYYPSRYSRYDLLVIGLLAVAAAFAYAACRIFSMVRHWRRAVLIKGLVKSKSLLTIRKRALCYEFKLMLTILLSQEKYLL